MSIVEWTTRFYDTVLSTLQQRLSMRVIGSSDSAAQQFVLPPADAAEAAVCRAQRVRVGRDFANVLLFGLLFVTILGGHLILIGTYLDSVVGFVARVIKSRVIAAAQRNWNLSDVLQIQRLAYKARTPWVWTREDKTHPQIFAEE